MGGSSVATPAFKRTFLQHIGIGVVVLVAVASAAVLLSVKVGGDQARDQPVAIGEVMASRIVAPLVTPGLYDGDIRDMQALDNRVQVIKAGGPIRRVKVWSANGAILYSDDPRLIGLRFPIDPDGRRVLVSHGVRSTVADLADAGNVLDRPLGESLQVEVGTEDRSGRPILVQTFFDADRLDADKATLVLRIVPVVLVSLLVLGLLLVPVAYSLARRVSLASGNGTAPPAGPGA